MHLVTRTTLLSLAAAGTVAAALQKDPRKLPDETWITLTGEVAATMPERFVLDHGDGRITVEMDDWDWYDEAEPIEVGQRLTVYGRVDEGLYEKRTIEADSVFVPEHKTFYYASDTDEEGDYDGLPSSAYGLAFLLPEGSWVSVSGEIEAIEGRELVLDTGFHDVRVDTALMAYDPLDDEGFQKLEVGHRISVTGTLDVGFFVKDEIEAATIVTLDRDQRKSDAKKKEKQRQKEKQKEMKEGKSKGKEKASSAPAERR